MGLAINEIFSEDYILNGKNSQDFDASSFDQVTELIKSSEPDIVINTVAFLGIDPCEKSPEKALQLNALYPKLLAELSNKFGFLLIHFSTDAVFCDREEDSYVESDPAKPLNYSQQRSYTG